MNHFRHHPRYKNRFKKLNESTVRGFEESAARRIAGELKKRGRPPVLSEETMQEIKQGILAAWASGTHKVISISIRPMIMGIIKHKGEQDKVETGKLSLGKSWINKLCVQLGLAMRMPTKAGQRLPLDWKEQGETFLHRLAFLVQQHDLDPDDVFNMDQTACQLNPQANGGKTRAPKGSKDVVVHGDDDKRQITVVPVVAASGSKLPLQIIFKGKDDQVRSIPDYQNGFQNLPKNYPGTNYAQTRHQWSTHETNLNPIGDNRNSVASEATEFRFFSRELFGALQ